MISKLTKLKLLVKEQGKIKVNPGLRIDFKKDLVIRFLINTDLNKPDAD